VAMGCSILEAKGGALNCLVLQSVFRGMLLKRGIGKAGNERVERENEQSELEMKLLIGHRVQGRFCFPIFHFPISHACCPLSVPRFSNTRFPLHIKDLTIRQRRLP